MLDALIRRVTRRPPDFVIGPKDDPYLRRWHLLPRNRRVGIYLHQMLHDDDDDRALHDHPYNNVSIILRGGYQEVMFRWAPADGFMLPLTVAKDRRPGRRAGDAHKLRMLPGVTESWSLFLMGPRVREWGFWCPGGRWVHWKEFTDPADASLTGKGCGQ